MQNSPKQFSPEVKPKETVTAITHKCMKNRRTANGRKEMNHPQKPAVRKYEMFVSWFGIYFTKYCKTVSVGFFYVRQN